MNTNKSNMKINIKTSICCLLISHLGMQIQAQVGIGNNNPNAESILDLTNSSTSGTKGLLLPISGSAPHLNTSSPEGLFIYYNGGIYIKESGGFNAINPWQYKYNGNTAEDISFNPGSMVGVGIGITTGNIFANLHVSSASKEVSSANPQSSALIIGNSLSAPHLVFDANEIMAKTSNLVGGTLYLQQESGSLEIGTDRIENVHGVYVHLNTTIGDAANNKTLTVHGNIDAKDKIQENGQDLLPAGSIIAFKGSTAPPGWARCDGLWYNPNNYLAAGVGSNSGGLVQTPNLTGRFIMGSGTGYTYNLTTAGGSNTKPITSGMIPNHTHTGSTNFSGSHSHTSQTTYLADNDDNDDTHYSVGASGGGDPQTNTSSTSISATGSNHSHTISTSACTGCGTTQLNVVSEHLILTYIMKL
ncbi:MAG: microcystin-dependent protein [Parvicella sp.]|jgi:microcystin-dependent protein